VSGAWLGALALCLGAGYGLAELTSGHISLSHAAFILGAPLLTLAVLVCLPGVAARLRSGHWTWAAVWVVLTLGGYALLTATHSENGAEILMLAGAVFFVIAVAIWGPDGPGTPATADANAWAPGVAGAERPAPGGNLLRT
jgi:hypothetical protein